MMSKDSKLQNDNNSLLHPSWDAVEEKILIWQVMIIQNGFN